MAKNNGALRRYCREVGKLLPCKGKVKRQMLAEIRGNILHFLEECPEADYDAIVSRFGTPQQIASACVEEMDTRELLSGLNAKMRIVRVVAVAAMLAVAIWFVCAMTALAAAIHANGGYYERVITEEEIIDVTEGDLK